MNLDGEPFHDDRLVIETHPARINLIR
jgi:hypothetical protein